MSAFRKRPDMLVLPVFHLTTFVDLTMPKRDWSKYDSPAHLRVKKKPRVELSAFLKRQAA